MSSRNRLWVMVWVSLCLASSGVVSGDDTKERTSPHDPDQATAKKSTKKAAATRSANKIPKMLRSDRFWRTNLDPNQYYVTRRKGTEQAFSGMYWNHHDDGVYACIGCGTPLFDSETKFDSGTGWPSYWQSVSRNYIKTRPDFSDGTLRTEVDCRVCDAHLGHVFNDGPRPTGLRFCINSASINFVARDDLKDHIDDWRKAMGLPPLEPEPDPETDGAKEGEPAAKDETSKDSPEKPDVPEVKPGVTVKPAEPTP